MGDSDVDKEYKKYNNDSKDEGNDESDSVRKWR